MTTITVTAEHIARGEREDCEGCPVALAIQEAFPDLSYSIVGPEEITMGPLEAEISLPTPREAVFFILAFDNGEPVRPFAFELDYPPEVAA